MDQIDIGLNYDNTENNMSEILLSKNAWLKGELSDIDDEMNDFGKVIDNIEVED